jgi:hypothetical protein
MVPDLCAKGVYMSDEPKAAVTVSEMAKMCGLSRARFYQLQRAGVFPLPVYDVATRRPIYVEELQKLCLEVRRRNCGINGKAVLFYVRRQPLEPIPPKPRKTCPKKDQQDDLIVALRALGLTCVTAGQVRAAIAELFPQGVTGHEQAEIIRAVFLHLKRRHSGEKVRW